MHPVFVFTLQCVSLLAAFWWHKRHFCWSFYSMQMFAGNSDLSDQANDSNVVKRHIRVLYASLHFFGADKHNPFLKSVCSHQWSDRPAALLCAHLILLLISFQQAHSLVIQSRVNTFCLILATTLFSSTWAARCPTKWFTTRNVLIY